MKLIVLCLLTLVTLTARSQKVDWQKLKELEPDKILLSAERKPTKVLLLGTFHFAYPQADAHKTDTSNFINVLSAERQKELSELAEVIARFKPTRFYIESERQAFHDSLYSQYRLGKYNLGRNEIYQVGYRVAGAANMNKLYAVDDESFAGDNHKKYPWIDSMWNSSAPIDSLTEKYWRSRYKLFYNASDSVAKTLTMLENFLLMAKPSTLRRMHGAYLTSGTTTNDGPDILAMWWFSRNLRIFNNILKTKPSDDDRIVLLVGNGHMPILRQCFESSPQFEVVELSSLLK